MNVGKMLILMGVVFIVVGALWSFVGKLPGDISFKKGNVSFHFPIMTSIVISVILTLMMYLFGKFRY